MELSFSFPWEVALMTWLQARMGPLAVTVASIFSMLGEELVVTAVLGFLFWCYDKEYAKFVGASAIAAVMWNPMVKNLVFRRRPYCDHASIRCLKPVEPEADIYDLKAQGYSFPSGHSATAAATWVSLALYRARPLLTVLAILLPLLVGLSRICLGVHYPTDVLAGWALGLITAFGIGKLQRVLPRKLLYLLLVLTGIPGWFYCRSTDFYSAFGLLVGFVLAVPFEERFVRFGIAPGVLRKLLRLAGGLAVFVGLNTLLKLPFPKELLAADTFLSHLIRALRYALVCFADIGLYPLLFRKTKKPEPETEPEAALSPETGGGTLLRNYSVDAAA